MKKIITIMLICCLCITAVSPAAASGRGTSDSQYDLQTAVALGLLDASAATRANETITRAEFFCALMRMFGNPLSAETAPFSDLPENQDYLRAINAAYGMGLLGGYGDGTVRPSEPIARSHAAALLAKAVGYAELIRAGKSAVQACVDAKICTYAIAADESDCTVATAAQLLINAGNANMVDTSVVGNGSVSFLTLDDTLLSKYLDIYHIEGVLDANEFTYLDGDGSLKKDAVRIDNENLITTQDSVKTLLGCNVEAYYKQKYGSKTKEIICCYPKDNKILEISADDVKEYRGGRLEYYDANGKTLAESFPLSAVNVIYNNRLLTKASPNDFKINCGTVTLIDNDNDGSYEVVTVLSYRNAVVDSVDTTNDTLYFKFGEKPLSITNDSGMSFVSADGSDAYLVEMAEWDVISVAESADGKVVRAVYIPDLADGVIEAIADDDDCVITVGGKSYTLTDSCRKNQANEISLGKYVMLYPGIDGKIAAVNGSANSGERYGYIIAFAKKSGMDGGVQIKYVDCDGTVMVSDLAENVKLDGEQYRTASEENVFTALKPQLMTYRRNDDGDVSYIDTAARGSKESDATLVKYYDGYTGDDNPVASESLSYKQDNMILGGKIALTSATYIFCIPTAPQSASDSDYQVLNTSNYLTNDGKYTMRAYRTAMDSLSAEAVVMYVDSVSASVPSDTAVSLVESVRRAVNADGDECYILDCYTGANRFRYETKEKSVFADLRLDGVPYLPKGGDVLKLTVDPSNRITACELVYSYGQNKMNGSNPNDSTYATYRVQLAYVWQTDGKNCMTTTTPLVSGGTYNEDELTNFEIHNLTRFRMIQYDHESEKVSAANSSSLIGFVNSGGYAASRVFVYTRNGNSVTFIVYR